MISFPRVLREAGLVVGLSHSELLVPRTARASMTLRDAFFGKCVCILLPSGLVKDQLLPERCPSGLFFSEFTSKIHALSGSNSRTTLVSAVGFPSWQSYFLLC